MGAGRAEHCAEKSASCLVLLVVVLQHTGSQSNQCIARPKITLSMPNKPLSMPNKPVSIMDKYSMRPSCYKPLGPHLLSLKLEYCSLYRHGP